MRLIRPMEHPTIPLAMLPQTHWREAGREIFASAWTSEVAEVHEFTDSEIHLAAGLLLPIWKRLPNESTRVYRLQTNAGERIVGRKVSQAWVADVLARGTPTLSADDAFAGTARRPDHSGPHGGPPASPRPRHGRQSHRADRLHRHHARPAQCLWPLP